VTVRDQLLIVSAVTAPQMLVGATARGSCFLSPVPAADGGAQVEPSRAQVA
jgi:hypothetical protein